MNNLAEITSLSSTLTWNQRARQNVRKPNGETLKQLQCGVSFVQEF